MQRMITNIARVFWQTRRCLPLAFKCFALAILLTYLPYSVRSAISAEVSNQPLKVGFIMVESVADYGWNYAHNQGRLYLESHMPGQVKTTFAENVPESSEVERVMEKMIAQGNKLIFATSYGYLEPALRVAARHPDVIIMECGRFNSQPIKNIGTYATTYYDPMYAVGIVAGRMTKKNEIGYVGGHPVPPLILNLNAFTLGAQSVNPKVKVHVVWTNSWHDPPTEAEAAKGLIDSGVDIIVGHMDSAITVVQTAERNHLYSIGQHADAHHLAPKGWLTGPCWDWGPIYVQITKSVIDHTWKPVNQRYGAKDGSAKLASFGPAVPKAVQQEATALLQKIAEGKFVVFKGPLKDRNGKLQIPAGKIADYSYLEKIDWVVPGIEGSIPQK
jgi:basic membrane protein A